MTSSVSSRLSRTLGQVRAQRVTDLALDLVDVVDQRLQRPVLGDPLGGGLLPHARDAGQVVARVAAQRREVGVLRRGEPVLLLDGLRGEPGELADALVRVEHRDVVADQLQRVAVAGDHQHPVALASAWVASVAMMSSASKPSSASTVMPSAPRTSLVMSIWPRNSSGVADRPALYSGYFSEPERLPGHVERRRDVGGLLVAQQVDQHRGEPVDRVGGQAALGLEVLGGQRVERTERQRIAVQQHQCRLFGCLLNRCARGHGPTLCTAADTLYSVEVGSSAGKSTLCAVTVPIDTAPRTSSADSSTAVLRLSTARNACRANGNAAFPAAVSRTSRLDRSSSGCAELSFQLGDLCADCR